ncbi:MAG: metallophosphoesterase [Candidatus Bathyarchaeia archaeon]
MKLLFSTDVHGSETCFRKFLNALRVYNVEVGILLGDLCGKMITPIVKQPNGTYVCDFFGKKIAKTEEELRALEKKIAAIGNYYFYTTPEEVEKLKAEGKTIKGRIDERAAKIHLVKGKIEDLFQQLATERLKNWIRLAEERLGASNIKMFMAPGNDDLLEIDEVLDSSTYVINADNKKANVKGHEMITISWSNPTPWDTPRECSEEELERKINELVSQIEDMESAIFNFHVPPYSTALDEAPALSKDLVPSVGKTVSAGSKAVLNTIKKYQPLLGLHGHIHESRGIQKIGRTVCLNPGSEYTEGILRGVIVMLGKKKVKDYLFTSG